MSKWIKLYEAKDVLSDLKREIEIEAAYRQHNRSVDNGSRKHS